MPDPTHGTPEPTAARASRRRGHPLRWLALVALLVLVLAGWFGWQALQTRDDLEAASAQAQTLQTALQSGDAPAARKSLADLQRSSRSAASRTDGVLWSAAAALPSVGDDVAAVRTVSGVLDDLSHQALPPVVRVASSVDIKNFSPKHGRVDLTPLKQMAPVTGQALRVIAESNQRLDGIDAAGLVSPLRGPVSDLQQKLGKAQGLLGSADTALQVLPSMLGEGQPRRYLVMFQNNAEVRATGGLPGAFAIVSAKDGKLSLGHQGSLGEFPELKQPILPLTHEEQELFTDQLGDFAGDSTLTPDFPRAAELARAWWQRQSGQQVDGVLSVDPIALSYLLKGTGPVALGHGQRLTADNAVSLLLHDAYMKLTPQQQDAFFAAAAGKVFKAVSAGQGDPRELVRGISKGVAEHRVLVWSANQKEQSVLAPTAVSGALPTGKSAEPHVGVYLNDATGAKMDYYLRTSTSVKPSSCTAAGVQSLPTTVTLKSEAPANAASLPDSVVGGSFGVPRGLMQVKLDVYAPTGGSIRNVRFDGKKVLAFDRTHEGRAVSDNWVLLKPGQTVTVTMEVTSGPGQRGDVHVDATPGAQPGATSYTVPTGCR